MEKMLSRVKGVNATVGELAINKYTNDITSDPLAQFAVVFAALIHDVDHTVSGLSKLKTAAATATATAALVYLSISDFFILRKVVLTIYLFFRLFLLYSSHAGGVEQSTCERKR